MPCGSSPLFSTDDCPARLPAAGNRNGESVNNSGSNGNYWSGSLNSNNSNNAYNLNFNSGNHDWNNNNRYYGHTVRPVSELALRDKSLFSFHTDSSQLLADLYRAYKDARRHKRRRFYQLCFELDFESELVALRNDIMNRTYKPSPSTCFIINDPKKREIFAAEFRDRVVHHLYYNYTYALFERLFITDSYSCRRKKGTHYGFRRLQHHIRSVSGNHTERCYVLKTDVMGYFMHISRSRLSDICMSCLVKMAHRQSDTAGKTWCEKLDYELLFYLSHVIIMNNPLEGCRILGAASDWRGLPRSKSLFFSGEGMGLPIGNLTSQLFSNVYMSVFDDFVKRAMPQFAYGRYVDDAFLVSRSKAALREAFPVLNAFLMENLNLELHRNKSFIKNAKYGIEFLGGYCKPYRNYVARDSLVRMKRKVSLLENDDKKDMLRPSLNSFMGVLSHYSSFNIRRRLFASSRFFCEHGRFNRRILNFKPFGCRRMVY